MKACFLSVVMLAGIAAAAEPVTLPLELGTLKTPLKTYEGVKVTGSDTVGIRIMHDGGMARIPYEKLPRELALRFAPPDRDAAKAQVARELAEQNAYHQAMTIAVQESLEASAAKPPGKSITELELDAQRMLELQEYVSHLKAGIVKAEGYITRRQARISRLQGRASYYACSYGGCGEVTDWSRVRRMAFIQKMAGRKQEKVDQARMLISDAEREMAYLEGAR